VFSGRPDPTWPVSREAAKRLVVLVHRLPPIDRAGAPRSVLGYRGCWLRAPDGEHWCAFDGIVVQERGAGSQRVITGRRDAERSVERAILATAPPGVLPGEITPES
jgi:hypothetical protein